MDRRLLRSLVPPRDRLGPDAGAADADLLDRYAADRDERAFEELLTRYGPSVWGVCRRTLARREDAEDAFQAAFVALIRLAESGARPHNLAGWLVKVAGRVSLNVRREAGCARRRQVAVARPESDLPVAESSYGAAYSAFREEIDALPDALRVAYLLCELGGTPQPQACAQLGLKPSALSARLTRARQRLEARLVARGLAPAIATVVLAGTADTLGAMPTRLAILAQSLAQSGVVIPSTLSALAATGVPVVISKLKLATLGAVALTAAGLTLGAGAGLMPGAAGQTEKAAPPAAEAPKTPPMPADQRQRLLDAALMAQEAAMLDDAAHALVAQQAKGEPKFEYRFHPVGPEALFAFKKLLESEARDGFEYVGLTPNFQGEGNWAGTHLVFKRPNPKAAPLRPAPGVPAVPPARAEGARPEATPADRLREAREAVDAASKLALAVRARLQPSIDNRIIPENSPDVRSAAATLSLLAKAKESLTGQAASTALIYLDEVHEALKGAMETELRVAVRIAIEAVKRAEAGGHPADALPPQLPPTAFVPAPLLGPLDVAVPQKLAGSVPSASTEAPLVVTPLPPLTAATNPLKAEVARLKAELDQTKRELDAQKTKAVEPYYVATSETCTPEQAAKIIASLKALGAHEDTRPSLPNDIGVVSILISNARPGDAALAEAMIRALGTSPIRVTPSRAKPNSPKGPPASSLPEPTPLELPKPAPLPAPLQVPPLGPPPPLSPPDKP